jgi:hypothetical protein
VADIDTVEASPIDPETLQQLGKALPDRHFLHPFLTDDWQQCVAEHAQVDKALLVLSLPDPELATPEQMAKAVAGARAEWLLEAPCSACALEAFAKVGRPYTLAGAPDRLFCSSFSVDDLEVEWMAKVEPVQKPFAGFADFDSCVAAQLERGKSQQSAESICGALQAESETKKIAKLLAALPDEIQVFKAADGDEGYVLGIVLEPEPFDGKGDAQKETYSAAEVRKAAHRWVAEAQRLGLMHSEILEGAVLADSFVIPEESRGLQIGKQLIKAGTWLLGFYLDKSRPEWPAVKRGEFTGLSIGGMARRRPA